jgi:hypothetical protein
MFFKIGGFCMRITDIENDYRKADAISAKGYVAVDSESKGTGKMEVSELSDTVILEYGDNSTYDDVLAMLNAGMRVLVNVDPWYNNNNAIGSDGVQKYPISPYKILLQANVPSGNPYIDFTGYINGQVNQVAHVQLWNDSAPSMPSKINNWSVNEVNPTELAKASQVSELNEKFNTLEQNSGGSNFRDGTKTGSPIMKNVILSGGQGDGKCLFFPERTQEEGNTFMLIPSSAFDGFTPSETDTAPFILFGCNINKNKFQALNLIPVKDDDGTLLGYMFNGGGGASLNIFGNQDTRFDGVNTFRPGSYGLRFRIKNNKTDTHGIMFKTDIATETSESIIGAGLLAYTPTGVGNYVVRTNGTIDEETGAHAGCFSLGEMLIPSGKNPQMLGTLGDASVPLFGLGKNGPGWYLLEANSGSSSSAESEMLVTFIESTPNPYPEDITQSVDKTFAEIKAAYERGLNVYATGKITYNAGTENETTQKDNTRIPLVSADDSMIVFEQTIANSYPTRTTRNYSVQFIRCTLLSDNTWTRTYEGKNLTDEILILNFDSDQNLGKTLSNNSTKPLKILRLNTNSEGSHFMDLNLIDSSSNLFGGVGLVEGVLSYVQVRIGYNGYTDETITEKTITPLQTVSEG